MHRHFGGTISRLIKLLAFVVAFLSMTALRYDNFEGQRQICSTEVLFMLKPARIFRILGRLRSFFKV